MNIFYLYKTGDSYISIVKLGVGLTTHLKHASIWENKKSAKSWDAHIKNRFPDARIVLAGLTIIEDNEDIIINNAHGIHHSPNYKNEIGDFKTDSDEVKSKD